MSDENTIYRGDDHDGTVTLQLDNDDGTIAGWHVWMTGKLRTNHDDARAIFQLSTEDETLIVEDPQGPEAVITFTLLGSYTEHLATVDKQDLIVDVRAISPTGKKQTWHVGTITVLPNVTRDLALSG